MGGYVGVQMCRHQRHRRVRRKGTQGLAVEGKQRLERSIQSTAKEDTAGHASALKDKDE